MKSLRIRPLAEQEPLPMDLLLLADPSEEMIRNYVGRGICRVAQWNDSILGVYVLIETRPATVELVNVAVQKNMQGKGIGKTLVLHAVETARRDRFKTLEVGTGNSSLRQLALYQKCGFRIVGVDLDFFPRHYEHPIMENGIECRDMIRLSQNL